MKSQVVGLRVSSAIFGLVCIVHLVRLLAGFDITVGSHHIGPVTSLVAIVVTGALSIWLGRLACGGCAEVREPEAPNI
jgi:hypothetical protein